MRKHRKAKLNKLKRRSSVGGPAQSAGYVPTENDANHANIDIEMANKRCLVLHTNFDADDGPIDAASAPTEEAADTSPKALTDRANIVNNGPSKRRKRKRRRQSSAGEARKRQKVIEPDSTSAAIESDLHSDSQNEVAAVPREIGDQITASLSADVKRYLIERLSATPSFLKLSMLNREWKQLCAEEAARWSRIPLRVDVARFFRDNNPFIRTFVHDDCKAHAKKFHDDVRLLVRMLLSLAGFDSERKEGRKLILENFTPKALGWLHSYSEDQLPTCPVILREKIRDLFLLHFNWTSKYIYCEPFFDSAMFINMVYHCQDKVTSLDLGDLKGAERILRCTFPNLEELIWNSADLDDLMDLEFPKLSVLSLTAEASSMAGFNILRRCPSLTYLYTGLRVPDNPTRFDLDVLLRCYQAFWNTSSSVDEDDDDEDGASKPEYVISTLPKLEHIGFWNAPEKALCSIRSFDLFVHCTFSATMPSSWVLDGRFKNSRSKLKQLTHFSLHMDGFCVFDDLDCHLPPCLTCVSISVLLPAVGAQKSVASLLSFIKRLADVNAYPDLEELHIQVWGIRCAESLLNQVADHLSDLRRLTIITMPVEEERDRLIDLIKHVASSCPRLTSLQLSAEMIRLLLDEYG
ncbi:hypothetical protein Y032_0406g887, partial [Ancylostoma ceylanicum]